MANNMISKDLGPATAYAIAVENGYTGTEEQWASEIANASNNAQIASQKASDAEAYAAGTRGGEAVDSDDPAYQNNAEYYSGEAADSAEAAAGSATSAAESAATASAAYNVNLLAPNYSSSNTYAVGDHVIYDGGYYECISAISTAEAWTAAHWRQVTVGAEAADLKSAIRNNPFNGIEFTVPTGTTHSSTKDQLFVNIKQGDNYRIIRSGGGTLYAFSPNGTSIGTVGDSGVASADIGAFGVYIVNSGTEPIKIRITLASNPIGAEIYDGATSVFPELYGDKKTYLFPAAGEQFINTDMRAGEIYTIKNVGPSGISSLILFDEEGNETVVASVTLAGITRTVITDKRYVKIRIYVNTSAGTTIEVAKITNVSYDLHNIETVIDTITKYNLESGAWSSGSKTSDSKRIRCGEKIRITKGTVFKIINSSLYYNIAIYETVESTSPLKESGWINSPWVSEYDGYGTIMVANGATYASSTNISPDDFGNSLLLISLASWFDEKTFSLIVGKNINNIEQGGWQNNAKYDDSKRIRCKDRIKVAKGTTVNILYSSLYRTVDIYETEQSTTSIETSGWINGQYTCFHDGYITIAIANNKTYASSTAITPSDFGDSLIVVSLISPQIEHIDVTGVPYYDKLEKYAKFMYGDSLVPEYVAPTDFENFLFFTDPHTMIGDYTYNMGDRTLGAKNFDKYIDELKFAYESSPTDFVLCGGDWNDGGIPAPELFKLSRAMEKCKANLSPFYNCVGNHDTNYQGKKDAESAPYTSMFTPECLRDLWYREYAHCYYTFNGKKTKFYVFDTRIETSSIEDNDYMMDQLKWFANALSTDNSVHIALAMHIYYSYGSTIHNLTENVMKVACTYNARTSIIVDGTTYDFSGATGKIEFAMVGHSHADFSTRFEFAGESIAVIGTINAGNETGATSSYYGSEYCIFDLINVNYDSRIINLVRIGSIGSDRTVYIDSQT